MPITITTKYGHKSLLLSSFVPLFQLFEAFEHWNFEFVSNFGFRILPGVAFGSGAGRTITVSALDMTV
jgi:hypothetical protein